MSNQNQEENQYIQVDGEVQPVENQNYQYNEQTQEEELFTLKISTIKGGLYGALLGGAIGGLCQGIDTPNQQQTYNALSLSAASGPLDLARGQLTDEGELLLLVSYACAEIISREAEIQSQQSQENPAPVNDFSFDPIANRVLAWKQDNTFKNTDLFTQTFAQVSLSSPQATLSFKLAQTAELLEKELSFSSQPLVAIIPFALLIQPYPIEAYPQLVLSFVSLFSHSQVSVDICLFSTIFIKFLLDSLGDNGVAFTETRRFFEENYKSDTIDEIVKIVQSDNINDLKVYNRNDIRYTFALSLFTAIRNMDFMTAESIILQQGADQSTDCTIAGAFSGFITKYDKLPQDQVLNLQQFDPESDQITLPRPADRKAFEIEHFIQHYINDFIINSVSDRIWESIQKWNPSNDFLDLNQDVEPVHGTVHVPAPTTDLGNVINHEQSDVKVTLNQPHGTNQQTSSHTSPVKTEETKSKINQNSNQQPNIPPAPAPLSASKPVNSTSPTQSNVNNNSTPQNRPVYYDFTINNQTKPYFSIIQSEEQPRPAVVPYPFYQNVRAPPQVEKLVLPAEQFETLKRVNSSFQLKLLGMLEGAAVPTYVFVYPNIQEIISFLNKRR